MSTEYWFRSEICRIIQQRICRNCRSGEYQERTMELISIRLLKNARDDIISTERCKRGHISPIAHSAKRRYNVCTICPPQVWYIIRRAL